MEAMPETNCSGKSLSSTAAAIPCSAINPSSAGLGIKNRPIFMIENLSKYGSKHNHPKLIVVHSMGEFILDPHPIHAADFLEILGLSAHALITPTGEQIILRKTNQGAYHARGFNKDSLGVEFLVEGNHDYSSFLETIKTDYITDPLWKAGIELIRMWHDQFKCDIRRHSDISPGRKLDPGSRNAL